MPDFFTLYLVVLLLNLSHCIIWGLIVFRYPDLRAARYWLVGSALNAAGGILLSVQGEVAHIALTVGANTLVVLGFYLNMCGVRRFHGAAIRWKLVVSLICISSLVMLGTFNMWYGRNPMYTAAQALPLFLTATFLVRNYRRELGAIVSSSALIAGGLAHGTIAVGNTLIITGLAPEMNMRSAASIDLLVFLFAGVVWNFGFLLSSVDELRAEVERLVNEDDLTGLASRRLFLNRLSTECAAMGQNSVFSLMLFDLDRFKSINDKHGHAAGDAALKHAAQVIRLQLQQRGVLARLGGDEFALLLPCTDVDRASAVAKNIVSALVDAPLIWRGIQIPVAASIGIAPAQGPAVDAETLMEAADNALYETKRRGRNGYTFANSAHRARLPPAQHSVIEIPHTEVALAAG